MNNNVTMYNIHALATATIEFFLFFLFAVMAKSRKREHCETIINKCWRLTECSHYTNEAVRTKVNRKSQRDIIQLSDCGRWMRYFTHRWRCFHYFGQFEWKFMGILRMIWKVRFRLLLFDWDCPALEIYSVLIRM